MSELVVSDRVEYEYTRCHWCGERSVCVRLPASDPEGVRLWEYVCRECISSDAWIDQVVLAVRYGDGYYAARSELLCSPVWEAGV